MKKITLVSLAAMALAMPAIANAADCPTTGDKVELSSMKGAWVFEKETGWKVGSMVWASTDGGKTCMTAPDGAHVTVPDAKGKSTTITVKDGKIVSVM